MVSANRPALDHPLPGRPWPDRPSPDGVAELRDSARVEAASRERALRTALKTTGNTTPDRALAPSKRVRPPVAGETVCFRCGTRASVGCRHNPLPDPRQGQRR